MSYPVYPADGFRNCLDLGQVDRIWNTWYETAAWRPVQTYLRLEPGASTTDLEELSGLAMRHDVRVTESGAELEYSLQAMSRIHLFSGVDYGISVPERTVGNLRIGYGDIEQVYVLSVIGALILVIGCINFTNSTTARSQRRAREVGLRKALGGQRKELIGQFACESILVALLAMALALILVQMALPSFNAFVGKSLALLGDEWALWFGALLVLAILVGILAGSYPAFYLSVFQPAAVLKDSFRAGGRGAAIRRALVIVQFSLSTLLINRHDRRTSANRIYTGQGIGISEGPRSDAADILPGQKERCRRRGLARVQARGSETGIHSSSER